MMNLKTQDTLIEQLYILNTLEQNFIQARLKSLGLNTCQARTLSYIRIHEGSMQKELALYLGKQKATVTNVLKNLEARGYLCREVPSDNGRKKVLYLSDKGKTAAGHIQQMFADLEKLVSKNISKEEQDTLRLLLSKLSSGFSES